MNTRVNQDYDGVWPRVEMYDPKFMSVQESAKFYKWYDEQKGKTFCLKDQLKSYCRADCSLLRYVYREGMEGKISEKLMTFKPTHMLSGVKHTTSCARGCQPTILCISSVYVFVFLFF